MNTDYLWQKLPKLIQDALLSPDIVEITINPDGKIWLSDRNNTPFQVGVMMENQSLSFINSIANHYDLFINEKKPYLDCILPFKGERLNATIPPIVEQASFNIRKKSMHVITLDNYFDMEILTARQVQILMQAINARKNILVSGGPGTGKTTLTNALLDHMAVVAPQGTRVLLLEQVAELQCRVKNHKRLLTTDTVDLRKLLWISMRNSPDRIIIGEVRDGAALDMLKAWNTGCSGGIATIHANSPKAALQRVIDLSLEVTSTPPYNLIAEAVDVIVQIDSGPHLGSGRRLTGILQVDSYDAQQGTFQLSTME